MGNITLREALDEYKNVYMAYRNFAERTRVEYQNDLENFIEFLGRSGIDQVKELGLPAIERYVAELERRGFAGLTRKRKVVTIRSFLTFMYQDGFIDTNIAKIIIVPFAESTTPNILTPTECDRLREACADSLRDKAIVELLLQTGIKLSELTRLTLNDIELERVGENASGFVRIVGGRGKKDRLIPFNLLSGIALKGYLNVRKNTGNHFIFLNRFGNPLGERGVQKMLKVRFAEAGISGAGVHTLRHTFGVFSVFMGKHLKTVRENLGLKDARSASVYASLARGLNSS